MRIANPNQAVLGNTYHSAGFPNPVHKRRRTIMKKNMQALMAAVAIGAGFVVAPMAHAQDAGITLQQQKEQERKTKQEQKAENRTEQQAAKAERRQEKHEREELNNMPKPVRQA